EQRHFIGMDNILWESDYPHTDTSWPNSRAIVEKHLGHLPADEQRKIAFDNAQRIFRLQTAPVTV
ncbi:MAG: amidohydrolase family protein, partial [Candidatus Dormibacteria bacterium]